MCTKLIFLSILESEAPEGKSLSGVAGVLCARRHCRTGIAPRQ